MEKDISKFTPKELRPTGETPLWMTVKDNLTIKNLSQDIGKLQGSDQVSELNRLEKELDGYYWKNDAPCLLIENEAEDLSGYWKSQFEWSFKTAFNGQKPTNKEDKSVKTKILNFFNLSHESSSEIYEKKMKSHKATSTKDIKIGKKFENAYCLTNKTQIISPRANKIEDLGDRKFRLTINKGLLTNDVDGSVIVKVLNPAEKDELTKKVTLYQQLREKYNFDYDDKKRIIEEYKIQEQLLYEALKIEGIRENQITRKIIDEDDDYSIQYNAPYKDIPLKIEVTASSRLQFFEFINSSSKSESQSINVNSDNISWSLPIVFKILDELKNGNTDFLNINDDDGLDLFASGPGKFSTSIRSADETYGMITFSRLYWELNEKNEIVSATPNSSSS
jgi:hypothetical protein